MKNNLFLVDFFYIYNYPENHLRGMCVKERKYQNIYVYLLEIVGIRMVINLAQRLSSPI